MLQLARGHIHVLCCYLAEGGDMPKPLGTKQLSASLSEEAYERLQQFTAENGTSMVSFLEALCRRLPEEGMPKWLAEVIKDARQIELQKRRRAKPPKG